MFGDLPQRHPSLIEGANRLVITVLGAVHLILESLELSARLTHSIEELLLTPLLAVRCHLSSMGRQGQTVNRPLLFGPLGCVSIVEQLKTLEEDGWSRVRGADISELYRTYSPGAIRLAYVLIGDEEVARDLVQDAFVRVFGRFRDRRVPDHFESYLRKTIVNLAKNHFRKRAHERAFLEKQRPDVPTGLTRGLDELQESLMQLPERQRIAIALRYLDDLSEHQTAEVMGTTVAAAKSLVQRGMATLREQKVRNRDE